MGNSFGCSYCLLILIGEEVGRCLDSFFFFSESTEAKIEVNFLLDPVFSFGESGDLNYLVDD